jgi:hypothetical protein
MSVLPSRRMRRHDWALYLAFLLGLMTLAVIVVAARSHLMARLACWEFGRRELIASDAPNRYLIQLI